MRLRGPLGWFTHDLTHRGASAWVLSCLLLGFYLGLYLSAETRRFATAIGIAHPLTPAATGLTADAALHPSLPSAGALGLAGLVGVVVAVLAGTNARYHHEDHPLQRAQRTGGKAAALTLGTMYAALTFANWLEPRAVAGRRLLPAPGGGWPSWVVMILLGGSAVAGAWGLRGMLRARRDRGAMLRAATLPLAAFYLALFTLLYGTHALDPLQPAPPGERSLRAFGHLLYAQLDSKWTLYGLLYTMAVTLGGVFVLGRYAHNRYQVVRTLVVICVQCSFGFAVPTLLALFAQPGYYLTYFWPLKIEAFYPDNILRNPAPLVLWSFLGSLVLVPVLGVFFGKRWYCSWVCGCGGLANTAGEPWRHLTPKGEASWKFEKVAVHGTLLLAIVVTVLVVLASWVAPESRVSGVGWSGQGEPGAYVLEGVRRSEGLVGVAAKARYYYGLVVGAVLSGVIGVGLYPLGGTRQWCRNFCPMAALLGLVQKFGRFRVRVKPDACISCGLCSSYCEMGIDVRSYAQANRSFTRASCVGCGLCAEVCPRGVLKLEQRFAEAPREGHGLVQIRRSRDA